MFQNTEKTIAKKPYCKVCHDAGKPESEYTNHWVKDLNGKTTCPTLLNTECRYCFKRGHTTKFCSVLAKNNKEKEIDPVIHQKNKPIIQMKTQNTNLKNGFAVLCNDDDEEEITNIVLGLKPATARVISWATIAATPALKEESKPNMTKPTQSKSWADWSDSDEDDELEEEEEIGYDTW